MSDYRNNTCTCDSGNRGVCNPLPLNLQLAFSTTDSFTSKVIKWFTSSKISHSLIIVHDETLGVDITIGAESGGFVAIPLTRFEHKNQIKARFKINRTDEALSKALRWLTINYLGVPYDYGAAGVTGIKNKLGFIWKLCGKWLRSKFTSPTKLMCSEALIRFMKQLDINSVKQLDQETTNAQILMEACFKDKEDIELIWAEDELIKKYG